MKEYAYEVSEEFLRYVNILRKSDQFNKRWKSLNALKNKISIYSRKKDLLSAIRNVMKDFFIPQKKDYENFFYSYLLSGVPYLNSLVRYELDACEENPVEISIHEPSILIQIFEKISEEEWNEIWHKHIKKNNFYSSFSDKNIGSLKRGYNISQYPNIDMYLRIYRMRVVEEKKPKEIARELSDEREQHITIKSTFPIDPKSISDHVGVMKRLLREL